MEAWSGGGGVGRAGEGDGGGGGGLRRRRHRPGNVTKNGRPRRRHPRRAPRRPLRRRRHGAGPGGGAQDGSAAAAAQTGPDGLPARAAHGEPGLRSLGLRPGHEPDGQGPRRRAAPGRSLRHDPGSGMPAPFVAKTYEMVADAATDAVVSWAPGGAGNSFVVWDPQALSVGLLPRFFKHANFASFIRQLNIYGFRKVNPDRWEFAHESFLAGQKHLLRKIKRRRAPKPQMEAHPRNGASICFKQPKDSGEVESLKRDRAALRAEVLTLKQQYSSCKSQLVALEERILNNERNQQKAIAFFAKVLSNPTFVQQVLLNYAANKELYSTAKRKRLMENEEQRVGTLKNGLEPTLATEASASAASSDGSAVAKHEPMPEWNYQEMDNIWEDVWDELDAIPGAEMDQEDKAAAGFEVEEFTGRPCGWVDDCPYLVEQMQFVEH